MLPNFDTSNSSSTQDLSQQQLNPEPSYYAVIPANVRYNKHLEANAKLLYGEITALSNREGYCWATNKYFAELYDVDERTIQRWLKSLRDEGFISAFVEQNGFNSTRKIFIVDTFQRSSTERQKCQQATTKTSPPPDKNAPHSITSNTTEEKQQQAAAVFDCLKDLKMHDYEKAWITQQYKESDVIAAVKWATAPTTKITKTIEQALKWFLKQQIKPVAGETDDQRAHNLRKFSCDLESKIDSSQAKYVALSTHTEIITTTTTICFDYTDRDFAEKQAKALAKYGFVKVK